MKGLTAQVVMTICRNVKCLGVLHDLVKAVSRWRICSRAKHIQCDLLRFQGHSYNSTMYYPEYVSIDIRGHAQVSPGHMLVPRYIPRSETLGVDFKVGFDLGVISCRTPM